jgi:hypothetical protein
LAEMPNAWSDVKDFKWLRTQKSPNWDILPEAERATYVEEEPAQCRSARIDDDEDEL